MTDIWKPTITTIIIIIVTLLIFLGMTLFSCAIVFG